MDQWLRGELAFRGDLVVLGGTSDRSAYYAPWRHRPPGAQKWIIWYYANKFSNSENKNMIFCMYTNFKLGITIEGIQFTFFSS